MTFLETFLNVKLIRKNGAYCIGLLIR